MGNCKFVRLSIVDCGVVLCERNLRDPVRGLMMMAIEALGRDQTLRQ